MSKNALLVHCNNCVEKVALVITAATVSFIQCEFLLTDLILVRDKHISCWENKTSPV